MNNITINDIAQATGFSANTVSRALRDKPDISQETKALIRRAAAEMGYQKNIPASALRARKTDSIGVIIPDIRNPVYGSFYCGIEAVCQKHGCTAFLFNSSEKAEYELEAINTALCHRADGIILFPSGDSLPGIELMRARKLPFVFLARRLAGCGEPFAGSDDFLGGYMACRHMLEKGKRDFIIISGPHIISSFADRCEGFMRCLDENGISRNHAEIFQISPTLEDARTLIKDRLASRCRSRAIFALSDYMAIGAVKALNELDIRIPQDTAVMGYDNTESGALITPALTTVDIRARELGSKSAAQLFSLIAGVQQPDELLPPFMVTRSSV